MTGPRVLLVQLPLHPGAFFEPTGNVPYAAALLASSAGLGREALLPQEEADRLGDGALAARIAEAGPDVVGFSLYCWNSERTAHLAGMLREALPDSILIAGGPEVHPDNTWLVRAGVFDVLVCGEAEGDAGRLLLQARRQERMAVMPPSALPPGAVPDPWLSGLLDPAGTAWVETSRGCSSSCSYCAYRRSNPTPRRIPAVQASDLCRRLREAGADELVFLDPTFDARPDLGRLLKGLAPLGASCFAEISARGMTQGLAASYRRAGFAGVEIGMQTWNREALEICGRPGDPADALEGARILAGEGVRPVLDLISGLPGDTPEGPVEAARRIAAAGMDSGAQVFHLAALPGTGLRESAPRLGLEYMDRPPYYVTRSGAWTMEDFAEARSRIADLLGFDLEMDPRPALFDGLEGAERFSLGDSPPPRELPSPPSARHGVLRLACHDPWAHRDLILEHVRRRTCADPWCVLDVVLEPHSPFPLDLLDSVRGSGAVEDYSDRVAKIHGTDGRIRPAILLDSLEGFAGDWLEAAAAACPLAVDVDDPGEVPAGLLEKGMGVRLPDAACRDLGALERSMPLPDRVFFRTAGMERLWTGLVLDL